MQKRVNLPFFFDLQKIRSLEVALADTKSVSVFQILYASKCQYEVMCRYCFPLTGLTRTFSTYRRAETLSSMIKYELPNQQTDLSFLRIIMVMMFITE